MGGVVGTLPRRTRTLSLSVLAAAPLLVAACGGDAPSSAAWSGTMDTLPSGAVRVNNPSAGAWEAGEDPPWELVAEAEIGVLEGEPAMVFGSIVGLASDDRDRILVVNRETREIRFYGPEGRHLESLGREGQGPGEYTAPNGLVVLPSDSLLVVDQEGARYSLLGPDGTFGRTVQRQLPFYAWVFQGGVDDGRVYEVFRVGRGEDAFPALIGTALRDQEATQDTIILPAVTVPPLEFEPFEVETEQFSSYLGVPFTPSHHYLLDGGGGVWFGRGDQFRLFHVTFEGDTLREITLQAESAPVTREELDDWRASEVVQGFESNGGKIDLDRIPDAKPYFDGLALDPDRNLWVSLPASAHQVRFAVFDSLGRYLGRIGFDGTDRLGWVPPVITRDRLILATKDDLGVNRVRVFRIEKLSRPAS